MMDSAAQRNAKDVNDASGEQKKSGALSLCASGQSACLRACVPALPWSTLPCPVLPKRGEQLQQRAAPACESETLAAGTSADARLMLPAAFRGTRAGSLAGRKRKTEGKKKKKKKEK